MVILIKHEKKRKYLLVAQTTRLASFEPIFFVITLPNLPCSYKKADIT